MVGPRGPPACEPRGGPLCDKGPMAGRRPGHTLQSAARGGGRSEGEGIMKMSIRHGTFVVSATFVAAFALGACYPDDIERAEELDTVTTVFNSQANFAANRRYSIADSVQHIPNEGAV